jgi:hypothetical protein
LILRRNNMEATSANSPRPVREAPAKPRRRRGGAAGERVRYFLPKAGSSSQKPELGEEAASEAEALVEAFRSTQVFYTLVAWSSVPELNGTDARITKRPLAPE